MNLGHNDELILENTFCFVFCFVFCFNFPFGKKVFEIRASYSRLVVDGDSYLPSEEQWQTWMAKTQLSRVKKDSEEWGVWSRKWRANIKRENQWKHRDSDGQSVHLRGFADSSWQSLPLSSNVTEMRPAKMWLYQSEAKRLLLSLGVTLWHTNPHAEETKIQCEGWSAGTDALWWKMW